MSDAPVSQPLSAQESGRDSASARPKTLEIGLLVLLALVLLGHLGGDSMKRVPYSGVALGVAALVGLRMTVVGLWRRPKRGEGGRSGMLVRRAFLVLAICVLGNVYWQFHQAMESRMSQAAGPTPQLELVEPASAPPSTPMSAPQRVPQPAPLTSSRAR